MNIRVLQDLVYHIARYAKEQGVSDLGATKLVKLLYLVDYEFFRWNRRTATEAPWIFYHFGPYSAELFKIAQQTPDVRFREPVELDGEKTFRACEAAGVYGDAIDQGHFALKGIVDGVLKRWGGTDVPSILNYVYFHTEPMQGARRGDRLDFSGIPDPRNRSTEEAVIDIGELLSADTKQRLRARLLQMRQTRRERVKSFVVELDNDAIEAMRKMDAEDITQFPDARVVLEEGAKGS
jgi:hypothetical protein